MIVMNSTRLSDLTDTVNDIEENIRREGLIGLANTIKEMNSFSVLMKEKVNVINKLSTELKQGSDLASSVVTSNTEITEKVTGFGEEISVSRQQIMFTLIALIVVVVSILLVLSATIIGPLTKAIEISENISVGDLSSETYSKQ